MKSFYDYWCDGIEYQNCFYWEDAIDSFKEALNIDQNPQLYLKLADCYKAVGKSMQAEYCNYMAHSLKSDNSLTKDLDSNKILINSETQNSLEKDLDIIKNNLINLYQKGNFKKIDSISMNQNLFLESKKLKYSERNSFENMSLKKIKKILLEYAFRKKTLIIKNFFELQPQYSFKNSGS